MDDIDFEWTYIGGFTTPLRCNAMTDTPCTYDQCGTGADLTRNFACVNGILSTTGTQTVGICGYALIVRPIASFTMDVSTGTVPFTVTFKNTSTNATTTTWDYGDGAIDSIGIHTYTNVGTYQVKLTATAGTETSEYIATVRVTPYIPPQNTVTTPPIQINKPATPPTPPIKSTPTVPHGSTNDIYIYGAIGVAALGLIGTMIYMMDKNKTEEKIV